MENRRVLPGMEDEIPDGMPEYDEHEDATDLFSKADGTLLCTVHWTVPPVKLSTRKYFLKSLDRTSYEVFNSEMLSQILPFRPSSGSRSFSMLGWDWNHI